MYAPETRTKRMEAAQRKVQEFKDRAAKFEKLRADALASAATWQTQWEWLASMPISTDEVQP